MSNPTLRSDGAEPVLGGILGYPPENSTWSPSKVSVLLIVLAGSSRTLFAFGTCLETRNGFMFSIKWTTTLSLSKKITSMGNRIHIVWILWQGSIHKPWPVGRLRLPNNPMRLLRNVSATTKGFARVLFRVILTACMVVRKVGAKKEKG